MLISLLVTILLVCVLCWFAFLAIDYFVSSFPPRPQPNPFNIAMLAKFVVVVVALVVIAEAAFGAHRWLIPVHGF